jgi:hypothetical protein
MTSTERLNHLQSGLSMHRYELNREGEAAATRAQQLKSIAASLPDDTIITTETLRKTGLSDTDQARLAFAWLARKYGSESWFTDAIKTSASAAEGIERLAKSKHGEELEATLGRQPLEIADLTDKFTEYRWGGPKFDGGGGSYPHFSLVNQENGQRFEVRIGKNGEISNGPKGVQRVADLADRDLADVTLVMRGAVNQVAHASGDPLLSGFLGNEALESGRAILEQLEAEGKKRLDEKNAIFGESVARIVEKAIAEGLIGSAPKAQVDQMAGAVLRGFPR